MAFNTTTQHATYHPGYFLAKPTCKRETRMFKADGSTATVKTAPNGGKYVPMGSIYKEGGSTAIGIVYEDVDVTVGDAAGSVVIVGTVYKDRLPSEAQEAVATVTGITVVDTVPTVTRPAF